MSLEAVISVSRIRYFHEMRRRSSPMWRPDGDEMAEDADDGDAGHYSGTYMAPAPRGELVHVLMLPDR